MSQLQSVGQTAQENKTSLAGRSIAFLYGGAAYIVFFASFLYAIGFVENLIVPTNIDTGFPHRRRRHF